MKTDTLIALSLLFAIATAAEADLVFLKNGGKLEGRVTERGDSISITLPYGTITVERDQVERIVRSLTKLEIYTQLKGKVAPKDVQAQYELALWCRENGLSQQAEKEFRGVLEQEPDHEKARESLGYQRHEGRWVTLDEAMTLRGYVRFRDQWVTPAQRDSVLLEELQGRFDEQERQIEQAEGKLEKAEDRIRSLESELANLRGALEQLAEEVRENPRVIIQRRYYPLPPHGRETIEPPK